MQLLASHVSLLCQEAKCIEGKGHVSFDLGLGWTISLRVPMNLRLGPWLACYPTLEEM